jgi:glyoxylase-like metal-dependent hydrolase (beta-lactamase superfamily II)
VRPRGGWQYGGMNVGEITIEAVSDGYVLAPATALFGRPMEDWIPHQQFLDADGNITMSMGGFLVRSGDRVVLIDVGIGPRSNPERTGMFMQSLGQLGVKPEDVTDVALTHLHFDHVGWASDGTKPFFPNATYRCHRADWDFFLGPDPLDESLGVQFLGGQPAIETLPAVADRIEPWSGDTTILPGIDVRSAPGHTPGSTILTISSGTDRAVLLGDVVHCPVELLENDWEAIGDVDPQLAARTRDALARELEGTDVPVAATHFQGLRFGRLLAGTGRRQWLFD